MSHSLILDELPLVPSPCSSPPTGLVVGQHYRVNGTVQGSLTFDYVAEAISNTQLASEVRVIVAGAPATRDGWRGTIDYADCQLTYLENNYDNRISGKTNIGLFPWLNSSYSNNVVDPNAVFVPGGSLGEIVRHNTLHSPANVNLSAAPATTTLSNNLITGTVIVASTGTKTIQSVVVHGTINVAATSGSVSISGTLISNTASITANGDAQLTVSFSALLGFSSIFTFVGATGNNLTVTQTVLNNGTISFQAATYRPTTVSNCLLASNSQIVFVAGALWNNTGNTTVTLSSLLSISSLTMGGGDAADASISVNRLNLLSSTVNFDSGTNSILSVTVENGTLNTAGFNISQSRLEGATSTLIADAASAQKSGYVGVLP